MRIQLLFELEKNEIPSDNRSIFISFLKKTLTQSGQEELYERYFVGTASKDYCFVPIFDSPKYQKDKIILENPRLKLIFSADNKNMTGSIFKFAFVGMKHKRFPLPDGNAMVLKKIIDEQEESIHSEKVIFRTVTGGGIILREHFREDNKDKYYAVNDDTFEEKAKDSLQRQATQAGFFSSDVEKINLKTISGKKIVVRLYGQFIDVSTGVFLIEATPEILQYFYRSGICSRTSMGYGMLQVIEQL